MRGSGCWGRTPRLGGRILRREERIDVHLRERTGCAWGEGQTAVDDPRDDRTGAAQRARKGGGGGEGGTRFALPGEKGSDQSESARYLTNESIPASAASRLSVSFHSDGGRSGGRGSPFQEPGRERAHKAVHRGSGVERGRGSGRRIERRTGSRVEGWKGGGLSGRKGGEGR